MATENSNTNKHFIPQTHEVKQPLPEASEGGSPSLRPTLPEASEGGSPSHRPTLPESKLEIMLPPSYIGVDQGGGGCIVYRPDGTRVDLKKKPFVEALEALHELSGIPQDVLQDQFIEEKKGSTLIKAELSSSEDLEQFANFFLAVWEYVIPPEFFNPKTIFVCGMTGKTRKTLFDLNLDKEWTDLIVSKMNAKNMRGFFLLLDCDFESLMEARDFNKHSDMLERAPLLALVQLGSSSSQASYHTNIAGKRSVICHDQNQSLGSRFTKALSAGYGPLIFLNFESNFLILLSSSPNLLFSPQCGL